MALDEADTIGSFIERARERGMGDEFIVALLRQNGWSERRIYAAFSVYYERVLEMPLPARGRRVEYASDAFAYVLVFLSLTCWTLAVGKVFYAAIERWFPSGLDSAYVRASFRGDVSWELATIIIAFPIFAFVSRAISIGLRRAPERSESGVRKWLTYLALISAAATLVGDGIAFLNAFLQGDLSPRFIAETVVLFSLAGGIFSYYLQSVRIEAVATLRDRAYAAAAGAAAIAALTIGFSNIGSPTHMRDVSADQRRIADLAQLQSGIDVYARRASTNRPPPSLASTGTALTMRDLISGAPYAYRVVDARRYELCADFATVDDGDTTSTYVDDAGRQQKFAHGIGHTCFRSAVRER